MPSTLGIVASGVQGFSPLELPAIIGWWDASDATTFTYSSGTSVSQWASKVGSYNLVQATGAKQPGRSGTINGLDTVVFDGTNDSFSVANFDMTGSSKFTISVVATASSGGDQVIAEHTDNFNNTSGAWIFYRGSNNRVETAKYQPGFGYAAFTSTPTLTTTPRVVVATHDATLSTNETSEWIDGNGAGTRNPNSNTTANNVNATMYVGARGDSSLFVNGQIAELVITTSALGTTDRELLQNYLAAKWGITL